MNETLEQAMTDLLTAAGMDGARAALDALAEQFSEAAAEINVDPNEKWLSLTDVVRLIGAARSSLDPSGAAA